MKLLFVSNLFPDEREPNRGLDNATLLHQLSDRCEIRVLALRPTLPFAIGVRTPRPQDRAFEPRYAPVAYLPKIGSRFNHWFAARAIREPLLRLKREFDFDVVLGSWIYPDCCALAMLARKIGFPLVAIAQGSDVHQYLRIPARRRIIVKSMPSVSAIVTRSAELARLLEEAGVAKEKLHPVYNGVDFACFQPTDRAAVRRELGLPEDVPILLSVGNLLPIKDPTLLVKAHAQLCRDARFAKARLVMVGAGPLEQAIQETAAAGGFASQVQLVGRQDARAVARYMQAADILCMPSKNEGVPNVILEAFAIGLPVVASRVGGIPEVHIGEHLGRLVPAGDVDAFTHALAEVLATSLDREAICAHGRAFSWQNTADRYYKLLNEAVSQNGG